MMPNRSAMYLLLALVALSPGMALAQFQEVSGCGLSYKQILQLPPAGKKGVVIISTSSCIKCKHLRRFVEQNIGNRRDVSLQYVIMDQAKDGLRPWAECSDGNSYPNGWNQYSGLVSYPFTLLFDENRTVVSRFDDVLNYFYAFRATDIYKRSYQSRKDLDWPKNWTTYYKSKCGPDHQRVLAFIESDKICTDYEEARKYYNGLSKPKGPFYD